MSMTAYMRMEDQMQNNFIHQHAEDEHGHIDSFFSTPLAAAHFSQGKLARPQIADVRRPASSAPYSYEQQQQPHSMSTHTPRSPSVASESSASPRSTSNPMDITRICINAQQKNESVNGKGRAANSSTPVSPAPFVDTNMHFTSRGYHRSQADLVRSTPSAQPPQDYHLPYGSSGATAATPSYAQAESSGPFDHSAALPHPKSQSNGGSQDSTTASALISLSNHEQRSPTTALLKRKLSSVSSPTMQPRTEPVMMVHAPGLIRRVGGGGDAVSIGEVASKLEPPEENVESVSSTMTISRGTVSEPRETAHLQSRKRSSPSSSAVVTGEDETESGADGRPAKQQRRKPGAWRDPSGFRKGITTNQMIDIDAPTRPKKSAGAAAAAAAKDTSPSFASPSKVISVSITSPSSATFGPGGPRSSSIVSAVSPRIAELRSPASSAMSSIKSEDGAGHFATNADEGENDLLLEDETDELGQPGGSTKDVDAVGKKRRQNTIAARRSRQRKLEQVRQLESNVRDLSAELEALRARMMRVAAENENLKHERDESVGKLWIGRAWVHKRPELSEPTKQEFLREIGLEQ